MSVCNIFRFISQFKYVLNCSVMLIVFKSIQSNLNDRIKE